MTDRVTVYFDGGCPVCRKEIGFYRRRRGADRLAWVDISNVSTEEVAPGLSKADAMARFHVRSPDGRVRSGARAFATLWSALPDFALMGRVMGAPGLVQILEVGYRLFLKIRRLWRPRACNDDTCALQGR